MQLYTCLNYINQALNYPAITYEDVSNFFDMAIADLNTSLHTDIPLISTMITKYGQYLSNELTNKVVLTNLTVDTTIPVYVSEAAATTAGATYYYNSTTGDYGLYNGTSFEYFPIIYGVLQINNNSQLEYYKSYKVSAYSDPVWAAHVLGSANFDLELYFPDEWVLLWLIPYICFNRRHTLHIP